MADGEQIKIIFKPKKAKNGTAPEAVVLADGAGTESSAVEPAASADETKLVLELPPPSKPAGTPVPKPPVKIKVPPSASSAPEPKEPEKTEKPEKPEEIVIDGLRLGRFGYEKKHTENPSVSPGKTPEAALPEVEREFELKTPRPEAEPKFRPALRRKPSAAPPGAAGKPEPGRVPPPAAEEKLSPEKRLAEAEALEKVRRLEAESERGKPRRPFGFPKSGFPLRYSILIFFMVGIFVFLYLFSTSLEKGASLLANGAGTKNDKSRLKENLMKKVAPHHEAIEELLKDDPPPARPEQPKDAAPPAPPPVRPEQPKDAVLTEKSALDAFRMLVAKAPALPFVLDSVRKMIDGFPKSVELHLDVMKAVAGGKYEKDVRRLYFEWARANPTLYHPSLIFGFVTNSLRNRVIAFKRAVAAEPFSKDAYPGLADALRELGKLPEAAAAYGKYISLAPDDPRAAVLHAVLMEELAPSGKAAEKARALTKRFRKPGKQPDARVFSLLIALAQCDADPAYADELLNVPGILPPGAKTYYLLRQALIYGRAAPAEALTFSGAAEPDYPALRILYHVSRREFAEAEKVSLPESGRPDFWLIFAKWHASDPAWRQSAELLEHRFREREDHPFVVAERVWRGKLDMAAARALIAKQPRGERAALTLLLILHAERNKDRLSVSLKRLSSSKDLESGGIYSTMIKNYLPENKERRNSLK